MELLGNGAREERGEEREQGELGCEEARMRVRLSGIETMCRKAVESEAVG